METIKSLFKLKKSLADNRKDASFSKKLAEFEAILDQYPDLDDHRACMLLYGNKNITNTYRSLKYRMEEKLMNDIFAYTSSEQNLKTRVNASIVVEKMTVVALTLLKNFNRSEGIKLMEKTLKLAEKYFFTELIIKLLSGIVSHYSYIEPNEKIMKKAIDDLDYYTEVFLSENYVKKCNAIISNMYVMNKGGLSKYQLDIIKNMVTRMQEIKASYKSNTIVIYVNDLTYFYYQSIGDHKKGLEIAKNALEETINLKNDETMGIYQNKMNIAVSNFYLKNHVEASYWFLNTLEMITKGTRNWFFATSLYYLNLICMRDYRALVNLTIEVINNKNLHKFPYFEEQWIIREAYLNFLIRSENITLSEEEKQNIKPFSLNKFMNSLPFHSKDKSGQNITIIVLQILFLLIENKQGQIIDRIDALTQYTYRYLRNDDTFRSNCFIKMLILMTKADFHPIRTQTYTAELKKKLEKSNLITDEKSTQVEIIPYDYLWDLILELLMAKKKHLS